INRAREEAGGADIRIKSRGPIELARGNVLTVRPIIRGFSIEPLQDTILWEGEIGNATFTITVPENAKLGSHPGFCEIHLNGLKISSLHFIILVATNGGELSPINSHEVRHRRVFASYASEDRDAVLARIQGLLKGIPDLKVFLDVASLHSGVRWQDALKAEILKSDLMYLFWSRAARESEWVDMEWRLGYREKGIDFIDPVPLVSPMEVPPPSELAELHFNDWILAYMRNTSSPNMESD
ncbi:MAG TPA: toll/interleukin-1 receptor domain-containing protein, partial [Candidatus Sumerlaeota bacterium]|nr:toll/interleukin-1 receptor domain-containing protein [Candidatus Sumerlaeota bacterium]